MESLFAAWALILVMNAVPIPMPPTWMVMAALRATVDLSLLLLTIGGTAAAALGRALFALQLRRSNRQLPPDIRANAEALAAFAHRRLRWPAAFVLLYSFLPLSSNPVFVAVGLGALPLRSSVVTFFLARSVYNTLMVLGSGSFSSSLADLFTGRGTWLSILITAGGIAGYAVLLKLPWVRWLGLESTSATSPDRPDPAPGGSPPERS